MQVFFKKEEGIDERKIEDLVEKYVQNISGDEQNILILNSESNKKKFV